LNNSAPSRVVSFANASRIVREQANRLAGIPLHPPQLTSLFDSLGRMLAEPVYADRDQPPFPRSTRDGFACRAADLAAGLPLTIIGLIRAGELGPLAITAGQAIEIMTGAPVPDGADCVVMVEHAQRNGETLTLTPGRSLASGENIVPRGAEARAGDVIVPRGTRISPAQVAAAAACGEGQLSLFARPRVAIVATGDELVEVGQQPLLHQIRNSNSYSLAAQVLAAGAEPERFPIARDERSDLEAVIRRALHADLLLLSGGVSMGKYDLVEEVLLTLGAEFLLRTSRQSCIYHGYILAFCRTAAGRSLRRCLSRTSFRAGPPGERRKSEDRPHALPARQAGFRAHRRDGRASQLAGLR
jgi:molybdopterin molybdotransferase